MVKSKIHRTPHYEVSYIPYYFVYLRPKYSPQHTFLRLCHHEHQRPVLLSHKPTAHMIVLCTLLFIFFGKKTVNQIIQHPITASIP